MERLARKEMRLIEITLDYPYANGEPFIEDELRIAEGFFDEIILVSMSGHTNNGPVRYVPGNVKLVNARKKQYEPLIAIACFIRLLGWKTVREIIFARKNIKAKENIIKIYRTIFLYYYYDALTRRGLRQIGIREHDVLYSYWMAGPAYSLAAFKHKCLTVTRTHRFDCFIENGYQPFRREIIEGMDAIYSISDAGKKSIERRLMPFTSSSEDKVRVARLGIFAYGLPKEWKRKEDDPFEILTCSYIKDVKRLDLIIGALENIMIPIRWTHIGDGELRCEIKKQAECLCNNPKVKYRFLGQKNRKEIYDYYKDQRVDLFVNCSDSEGIPVSIMEALSFGIPVVTRNVGGNSEIVDGSCGILLDEAVSSSDLSDAICKMYELEEGEYSNLRKGAYVMFRNRYDAKKNYAEFFDELSGGGIS